jgi:hypothetical protein
MKKTQHSIVVGMFVGHTSQYGMGKATGRVIAEAGMRYGRRYLWVNYTTKGKTFNSAFWDAVLVPSNAYSPVLPPTTESTSYDMWR